MLHALDADHIMAVTGLAATQSNTIKNLRFCIRWAMGHGIAVLLIGGMVILLGMAIPERLSAVAEAMVGGVLIIVGLWVFFDLFRLQVHIHSHQHDGLPRHTHWHRHDSDASVSHAQSQHLHSHSALFVGLLHGTAGAAPLLVLLPVSAMDSPVTGFTYLLLFCLGVIAAMLIFGGMLNRFYGHLGRYGVRVTRVLRGLVAASSVLFGLHLAGVY